MRGFRIPKSSEEGMHGDQCLDSTDLGDLYSSVIAYLTVIDLRRENNDTVAHENWFDLNTLRNRDSVIKSDPVVIARGFTYSFHKNA